MLSVIKNYIGLVLETFKANSQCDVRPCVALIHVILKILGLPQQLVLLSLYIV